MRASIALVFVSAAASAQSFEVASVKPSLQVVGGDYNNRVTFGAQGFTGRNVTLKRLIAEAYNLQPHQVFGGAKWLGENEYDIEAKADQPAAKEQVRLMLRSLVAERFGLKVHSETKELHLYYLLVDKNGPKISPGPESGKGSGPAGFHGDLQQLANLISIQLTIPVLDDPTKPSVASGAPIPVLDKTGLSGTYHLNIDLRMEPGSDSFLLWQRLLQERFGLKLESRKGPVEVLVVDSAERVPTAN